MNFCEISKNTFSYRTPPVTASVRLYFLVCFYFTIHHGSLHCLFQFSRNGNFLNYSGISVFFANSLRCSSFYRSEVKILIRVSNFNFGIFVLYHENIKTMGFSLVQRSTFKEIFNWTISILKKKRFLGPWKASVKIWAWLLWYNALS